MTCLVAIITVLLTGPAGRPGTGDPGGPAPAAEDARPLRLEAIVIDAEGVPADALREAVALRLPQRILLPAGDPRATAGLGFFGYLQVRPAGDGRTRIALVLSDGRAYYRDVESEGEDATRTIASQLANLVAGIEEERIEPDARDVPLPEPRPEPSPTVPPPKPTPVVKRTAAAARPEVGVALDGGLVPGIPPPSPAGLAAGGGGPSVVVRLPRGAAFGVATRVAGRTAQGYGLVRIRVSAEAGWIFRRRAFELALLGALDVEPWLVTRGGARQALQRDGSSRDAALGLGGHVRVAPGWRRAFTDPHVAGLRLGIALEIGGSGMPTSPGGVARVRRADASGTHDVFRVGGVEAWAGLELVLWLRS